MSVTEDTPLWLSWHLFNALLELAKRSNVATCANAAGRLRRRRDGCADVVSAVHTWQLNMQLPTL